MNSTTSSGCGSTSTANGQIDSTTLRLSSHTARHTSGKAIRPVTGFFRVRVTGFPRRAARGALPADGGLPAGGASAATVMRIFLPAGGPDGPGRAGFADGAGSRGDRPAPAEEA